MTGSVPALFAASAAAGPGLPPALTGDLAVGSSARGAAGRTPLTASTGNLTVPSSTPAPAEPTPPALAGCLLEVSQTPGPAESSPPLAFTGSLSGSSSPSAGPTPLSASTQSLVASSSNRVPAEATLPPARDAPSTPVTLAVSPCSHSADENAGPAEIKDRVLEETEVRPEDDRQNVTELPQAIITETGGPRDQHTAIAADRASRVAHGVHRKAGKELGRASEATTQGSTNQGASAAMPTGLTPASQSAATPANVPSGTQLPPHGSNPSASAAMFLTEISVPKAVESHRPSMVGGRAERESGAGHTRSDAPEAALFMSGAEAAKTATPSEIVPEPVTSAAGLVAAPISLPAPDSLLPSSTDQDRHTALPVDRVAPADQVAPALVAVLKTSDGTAGVTVRLQPPELGQVQIRIVQTTGGTAHINIITDRPETLRLLQRDEPRLQQALDQAGVLSTGRTVSFQVVAPEQAAVTAARQDGSAPGSGDSGQGQSGGMWRQNDDSPRNTGNDRAADQRQTRARWFRAGLDITA